jgi:hypothetical protein
MVTAATILFAGSAAQVQQPNRPATISGHANFNGICQALNTAYWNLEGLSVEGLSKDFFATNQLKVTERFKLLDPNHNSYSSRGSDSLEARSFRIRVRTRISPRTA